MFTSTDKYSDEIAQTMPVSCFFGSDHSRRCGSAYDLARIVHPRKTSTEPRRNEKPRPKTPSSSSKRGIQLECFPPGLRVERRKVVAPRDRRPRHPAPPPHPMPTEAPNPVFVTVGTTSFDALVRALDTPRLIDALRRKGCPSSRSIGRGTHVPTSLTSRADDSFPVHVVEYLSSIDDEIARAGLVISHAGAGSVFETMRRDATWWWRTRR